MPQVRPRAFVGAGFRLTTAQFEPVRETFPLSCDSSGITLSGEFPKTVRAKDELCDTRTFRLKEVACSPAGKPRR